MKSGASQPCGAEQTAPLQIACVSVADLPEGGGNTSRLKSLVAALTASGHSVRIWNEHALGIAPPESLEATGRVEGVEYTYVLGSTQRSSGFGMLVSKLSAVAVIAQRLWLARRAGELDLVWFNNLSAYDLLPLTLLARSLGVPTVQSYEDERYEAVVGRHPSLAQRVFALNSLIADRLCAPMADAVVVISHYLEAKYARLCGGAERVHLLPTIVDCEQWQLKPRQSEDCPVILYAGAFGEQDELSGLAEALAILDAAGHAFRLMMLGANRREQQRVEAFRQRVRELGVADRVEMRGFVPLAEVRAAIESADVLYSVRRDGVWSRSGLSTKLSEYLATGRAVVASDVGDVGAYLRDGESALLVSAGASASEIAAALERALDSPELRRRVGAAGAEVARRHFDAKVARQRLAAILDAALGRSRAEGAR